tara:strand:- start:102 stop:497 length:396 start_codon:yes stop_codon:yes gene_type:complete
MFTGPNESERKKLKNLDDTILRVVQENRPARSPLNERNLDSNQSNMITTIIDVLYDLFYQGESPEEMGADFTMGDFKKLASKKGKYQQSDMRSLKQIVGFFNNYMYDAGLDSEDFGLDRNGYKNLLKTLRV